MVNIWYELVNYFFFLFPCLASTYIILASIDRYCASSLNDKLQKLNQLNISRILVLSILLYILKYSKLKTSLNTTFVKQIILKFNYGGRYFIIYNKTIYTPSIKIINFK